jgi:hypothetical protein
MFRLGGGAAARRTDSGDHAADRAESAADRLTRPKDRPPPGRGEGPLDPLPLVLPGVASVKNADLLRPS